MPRIVILFLLSAAAFSQASPLRIPAEDAAKHLLKAPEPDYPPDAREARIQGNVILQIEINEVGDPQSIRLISGHPMLVNAAIKAVSHWKYTPYQVDGKPARVVTDVLVAFGNKKYYAAAGQAELTFRYDFWSAEDAAQAAFDRKDYPAAEQQLTRAQKALASGGQHPQEEWDWLTASGRLRAWQQKYDEAEKDLNDALALSSHSEDATVTAISLSNLGALLAEEKKYDLAREKTSQALSIYRSDLRHVKDDYRRRVLGNAAAGEALRLLKIAQAQNDDAEKARQCQTVAEFQSYLSAPQQASVTSACPSVKVGH